VVTPGGHGGHVLQGLALDLLVRHARAAPGLPGGRPLEPLLKGLELAGFSVQWLQYRSVSIGMPQLSQAGIVVMRFSLGRPGAGWGGVADWTRPRSAASRTVA
jgi:hypothetical protein